MNRKTFFSLAFLFFVCIGFFYKTFIFGQLPFPGDLLINENPYKGYSYLEYAPGGYPNKGQGRDVIREILPWKKFSISELKNGHIPFWNPYNFSGSIQMQNFQTAIFYPMNILFFILPFSLAWSLFIFSQPLLASFFMFFFLRKLERSYGASILGAVAFASSSYMSVWIEYGNIAATFLWLPLMLLFLYNFIQRTETKNAAGFIITSVIAFFGGYIQGYFYMMTISFAFGLYLLFKEHKLSLKNFLLTLPLFIFSGLIGAIQLLPTLEVFNASTRVPYTLSQIQFLLNPLFMLPTTFIPDFFGNPATRTSFLNLTYIERVMYPGVIVGGLFVLSLFLRKQKYVMFFLISGLLTLLMSLRLPGVDHFYQLPIPILSTGVPTRILSLFLFCAAVVAAYAVDSWSEKPAKKILFIPTSIFICLWVFVFIGSHFGLQHVDVMKRSLIIPTGIFIGFIIALLKIYRFPLFGKTVLISLLIADLFFFFQKITPFAPQELLYPKTSVLQYIKDHEGLYRMWGYGDAYIPPNIETFSGIYGPEGEDPLHIKRYGDLLAASETGDIPVMVPRPDANISPGFGVEGLKNNPYRKRLLDMLGVKYIINRNSARVADTSTFPETQYSLVFADGTYQVYENKNVLPRVFLTSKIFNVSSEKEAIHTFYHESDPYTAVTEIALGDIDIKSTGSAVISDYSTQNISIKTQTTGLMLLVLSDTNYPSWQATIDGEPTRLYTVNVALRGIVVPGGEHTIKMVYTPRSFFVGAKITMISILIVIGYLFVLKKYVQKN